jgi:chaperonin cofactor prefoldin
MTRSFAFSLSAAVVVVCQTVALAAPPARFVTLVSRERTVRSDQPRRTSANLPQTSQLDNELRDTQQSLDSLAAKIHRTEQAVESARKAAQDVQTMIKALGQLDSKIGRIQRELDSLARIPQLRMLKPLVKSLDNVHGEIHKLRVKADQADRDYVRPMISRLKSAERTLETKLAEVRQVANQTQQARQRLAQLRSFVEGRGNRPAEVAALEAVAKGVHATIGPVSQMVSQLDRSLGNVERDFNGLTQRLSAVSRAKGSLSKLDRDLAAADKVARDLDKVMSKTISIKFPVKVSVSVRQILEAPGKLLDIVVKPLEKLARKALDPILSKTNIHISLPRELTSLSGQFDGLSSVLAGVQSPISKIEQALQVQVPQNYGNQISRLAKMTTSQLAS